MNASESPRLPGELQKKVSTTFVRAQESAEPDEGLRTAMSRLRIAIKQLEDGQSRVEGLFRDLWEREGVRRK